MTKIEKTLKISFSLIMLIFLSAWGVYLYRYQNQMSKDILSEQAKVAKLTSNALNLYFDKLRYAIESSASSNSFKYEKNITEDKIRFTTSESYSLKPIKENNTKTWNYFKGLPLSYGNKYVASSRRAIAKNILDNYKDIHYVFEMDLNGDLVFLEPYSVQKKITSFNYKFRDYLKLVKKSNKTSISEGYISHDKNRTHIITVATPIKDRNGYAKKVFAASISAKTLHDRVLSSIAKQIGDNNYKISLIDKHGHIVANSSDLVNYSPSLNVTDDSRDLGNIRKYGIFDKVTWKEDVFEKHNVWERRTKSWDLNNSKVITHKYSNQDNINVFGTLYPISIYKNSDYNWGILVETPTDTFYKESFVTFIGFVISFMLIVVLLYLVHKKTLREYRTIESDVKRAENDLKQLARKVRHDIRSPLTSMEYLFEGIKPKLEEEERLIGCHSLERINDIILTLSPEKKNNLKKAEQHSIEILYPLVSRVIAEKRIEYKALEGISIKLQNKLEYGVFVNIDKSDLARSISNLINNSVEAKKVDSSLEIKIILSNNKESCFIKIEDNGIGIDKDNLDNILEYGVSHNKASGKGIGLSQAKEQIERANGTFNITSTLNIGTTIQLALPRSSQPSWFKSSLRIKSKHLCIVDDDESIHLLWAKKLSNYNLKIVNIKSSNEFDQWATNKDLNRYQFLFDLELLGSKLCGLELIENHSLSQLSTLVTSHYNDIDIQKFANNLGVKIVPKDLASDVPVSITDNYKKCIVLIDDDELVHMTWKRRYKEHGIELNTYFTIDDFLKESKLYSSETPIYLDSNLGDNIKGEVDGIKISNLGFNNMYITTGYSSDSIDKPTWIKKIIDKSPELTILS